MRTFTASTSNSKSNSTLLLPASLTSKLPLVLQRGRKVRATASRLTFQCVKNFVAKTCSPAFFFVVRSTLFPSSTDNDSFCQRRARLSIFMYTQENYSTTTQSPNSKLNYYRGRTASHEKDHLCYNKERGNYLAY